MDKKKKIIIGSVVAVSLLVVVIGFGVSSNKKNEGENINSETTTESNNKNDTTINNENSNENQPEIKPATGSNFKDFEESIKDIGYTYFDDGCYDLFENDKSIALVQIMDNEVLININNKNNINNESISKAIEILIPNESEEIYNQINLGVESIALALDNRTVSIETNNNEVKIIFSK